MNDNLIQSTCEIIKEKLKNIEYGKVVIHVLGKNKIDIEVQKRERIGPDNYHKG
jgi:hypothetical protein